MYVRVHAARIRERKRDRLEPEASRYPRISGRAVYGFNQRSYNYLNNV